MNLTNLHAFYRLGRIISQIRSMISTSYSFGESPQILNEILDINRGLELHLKASSDVIVPRSRHLMGEMRDVIYKFIVVLAPAPAKEETQKLLFHFKNEITPYLDQFETDFQFELRKTNVVTLGKKGIYDIFDLIERPHEHFSEEVRRHLPDTAVYDFKEAGKCLAFDCYTAMAYHILRGTEAVVLKYLETVIGEKWTGQPGWGQYVQKLEKKSLNVPIQIIQRLNEIREYERNPIAHPEFVVQSDDAMPLFGLVLGVIPMITKEMQRINPK